MVGEIVTLKLLPCGKIHVHVTYEVKGDFKSGQLLVFPETEWFILENFKAKWNDKYLPTVRKLPFVRGVGFTSRDKVYYAPVNVDDLAQEFNAGQEVNPMTLVEAGLVHSVREPVVVLGRGELDKVLLVKAHRVSDAARAKIEKAGGSIEILPLE